VHSDSRSFHELEYALDGRVLTVHFKNGHTYAYEGVLPLEVKQLLAAESQGAYFNQHIRDRHRFRQVA
jgi:hypothetical protein